MQLLEAFADNMSSNMPWNEEQAREHENLLTTVGSFFKLFIKKLYGKTKAML